MNTEPKLNTSLSIMRSHLSHFKNDTSADKFQFRMQYQMNVLNFETNTFLFMRMHYTEATNHYRFFIWKTKTLLLHCFRIKPPNNGHIEMHEAVV